MNLLEARKQAHEGWVRSPSRTGGYWRRIRENRYWYSELGDQVDGLTLWDIDAEDWEPKPAPKNLWEAEVWVSIGGSIALGGAKGDEDRLARAGWRKIRVREVAPEPSPAVESAPPSSAPPKTEASTFRCRKCGSMCVTEQGAMTCCWNHP